MSLSTKVGRLMTFTAKPGKGDELAAIMLRIAENLRGAKGCEIYLVSQDSDAPDNVRVVEAWTDLASADAALATAAQSTADLSIDLVMSMLAGPPERVDMMTLGGVGL